MAACEPIRSLNIYVYNRDEGEATALEIMADDLHVEGGDIGTYSNSSPRVELKSGHKARLMLPQSSVGFCRDSRQKSFCQQTLRLPASSSSLYSTHLARKLSCCNDSLTQRSSRSSAISLRDSATLQNWAASRQSQRLFGSRRKFTPSSCYLERRNTKTLRIQRARLPSQIRRMHASLLFSAKSWRRQSRKCLQSPYQWTRQTLPSYQRWLQSRLEPPHPPVTPQRSATRGSRRNLRRALHRSLYRPSRLCQQSISSRRTTSFHVVNQSLPCLPHLPPRM